MKSYEWHFTTPTLHKILIHCPTVYQCLLSIGQLFEESVKPETNIVVFTDSILDEHSQQTCAVKMFLLGFYYAQAHFLAVLENDRNLSRACLSFYKLWNCLCKWALKSSKAERGKFYVLKLFLGSFCTETLYHI